MGPHRQRRLHAIMEWLVNAQYGNVLDKYPYDFSIAKYAKQQFASLLALAEFKYGITINNVFPGIIETIDNERALEIIQGHSAQEMFLNPLDVANAIVSLQRGVPGHYSKRYSDSWKSLPLLKVVNLVQDSPLLCSTRNGATKSKRHSGRKIDHRPRDARDGRCLVGDPRSIRHLHVLANGEGRSNEKRGQRSSPAGAWWCHQLGVVQQNSIPVCRRREAIHHIGQRQER